MGVKWYHCGLKCAISYFLTRPNIFSCVCCAVFLILFSKISYWNIVDLQCYVSVVHMCVCTHTHTVVHMCTHTHTLFFFIGIPRWLGGKVSIDGGRDAGDAGSVSGWGRSPGGGSGNTLQYFCQENSIDRGAWQATVHGVTKSQTGATEHILSTRARAHTHTLFFRFFFPL